MAAQLEAAMADLERSRADFERKAHAVGAALRQLQQDVAQAPDAPVTGAQQELELGAELGQQRRLSGAKAPPAGQQPDWHVDMYEEKRRFNEAAEEVAEKLQGVSHALARVHVTVQQARASVDTAKAEAAPLLGPERLAAAREARNGSCSALLVTLGHVPDAPAAVLGELSVAAVWRLRGVSRAFRGWCGSALAAMPRVVAVGGRQIIGGVLTTVATAVSLDLATLAWGGSDTVPDLPAPCAGFSLGKLPGGRLVAAGGTAGWLDEATAAAFEWAPGRVAWTPLPVMCVARAYAAAAVLSDGGMLVARGFESFDGNQVLASVEVLAADGSGWAALPPMATTRYGAVAGRLPGGQVIVAGGMSGVDDGVVASAGLWDPATGAWAALPPMAHARHMAAGCVLPSGRFAVLGGGDEGDNERVDAEAFDLVSREWQPLPPMPHDLVSAAAVAVAGGLLAVGGAGYASAMLFDEESARWFTLPGQMSTSRGDHGLTTIPAP
jgi:hypothetical protein